MLALAGYLLPALIFSQTQPSRLTALLTAVIATTLFCLLLRGNKEKRENASRPWSVRLVAGRLIFTATLVLVVTECADLVGTTREEQFLEYP